MTDRIKEQLSAFLDGELPDPESALLLKRLERDDELRGALSRYSLIGAVLRSDGDVPAARQVAARVSAAIAKEPFRAVSFVRLPRRGRMRIQRSLREPELPRVPVVTPIAPLDAPRHLEPVGRGLPVRGQRTRSNARTRKGPRKAAIKITATAPKPG